VAEVGLLSRKGGWKGEWFINVEAQRGARPHMIVQRLVDIGATGDLSEGPPTAWKEHQVYNSIGKRAFRDRMRLLSVSMLGHYYSVGWALTLSCLEWWLTYFRTHKSHMIP
jgi:hypothetical protein